MRWIFLRALLIAVTTAVEASPQTVPAPSFDLTTFAAEMDRLATSIGRATESDAFRLRQSLPDRWHIETDSGRYEVSTSWLVLALPSEPGTITNWPARRTRIRDRLATLSAEARALARRASGVRAGAARAVLDEVLQRREFQQGAGSAWRRRIEQKIRDLLVSLSESLGVSPGTGRRAAVALAWIAGVSALLGLGIWLARSLAQPGQSPRLALNSAAQRRVSAREWAERSSAAMQCGDLREAVRCAYHACLRQLEDQGAWRVDPARTAREYLRLLPPRHDHRETVTDLTWQFEQVWYGSQPLTPDDARRVTAHLEGLGCLPVRQRAI